MAARAAQEVLALREKFKSLGAIYRHLLTRVTREGWPVYHAAVAAELAGDIETSRQLFQRLANWPTYGYDWQLKMQSDGAALAKLVDDPTQFRSAVLAMIDDARSRLRLPSDSEWRVDVSFAVPNRCADAGSTGNGGIFPV